MLIDYYKAIEDSSARMRDAAKAENWDEVARFEATVRKDPHHATNFAERCTDS